MMLSSWSMLLLLLLLLLLSRVILSSLSAGLGLQVGFVSLVGWLLLGEERGSRSVESVVLSGVGKEHVRLVGLLRRRRWQVNSGAAVHRRLRMWYAVFVGEQNLILIIQNVVSVGCSHGDTVGHFCLDFFFTAFF